MRYQILTVDYVLQGMNSIIVVHAGAAENLDFFAYSANADSLLGQAVELGTGRFFYWDSINDQSSLLQRYASIGEQLDTTAHHRPRGKIAFHHGCSRNATMHDLFWSFEGHYRRAEHNRT